MMWLQLAWVWQLKLGKGFSVLWVTVYRDHARIAKLIEQCLVLPFLGFTIT